MSSGSGTAEGVDVRDVPERERYEITVERALAGFTSYQLRSPLIAYLHTEVDPRLEGRGLASALIRFALGDARDRGLGVLPFCPFVRDFIEHHHEYLDLVPAEHRSGFGL